MAVKRHMTKANMADVVPITFLLHTYRIEHTFLTDTKKVLHQMYSVCYFK